MKNRFQKGFLKTITISLIVLSIYLFLQFYLPWPAARFVERLGFVNIGTKAEASVELEHKVYLPQAEKNHKNSIDVDRIWTANIFEEERVAYLLGDTIVHYVSGLNSTGELATADLTWTQQGPCGQSEVSSDTLNLDKGSWEESYFTTLLDCVGIHTHTVQITHKGNTITQSTDFVVNNPSAVTLSDRPAFDICGAPSLYQLQRWMDESPYWGVNIYIGGIHRGCGNSNLDAFWVHEANQQGWQLIPTWVGPQAACSKFTYRIFSDPELALIQGRIEADAAYRAAEQLGFLGGTNVIYYDLEGYAPASIECRQASASFLEGWTERLHEYNVRAGAYGGACSSYMKDWAANNPLLDNVWIADWMLPPEYREDASVYDVRCLDAPEILYWTNNQRIRQYAGDHYETWGGVKLGIDSNIADGEVAFMTQGPALELSTSGASELSTSGALEKVSMIQDVQLISPDQGWALSDQRLLWTEDGGSSWNDITPVSDHAGDILSAYFSDNVHGWVAARATEPNELLVYRTGDGGMTWGSINLDHSIPEIGNAHLLFVDATTGWLVLKQQTSANFSLGELFRTVDGGENWEQLSLPIGEPVQFMDADRGWVVGGVEGNELYVTNDGGLTWEPQGVVASSEKTEAQMIPPDSAARALLATLPDGTLKTTHADSNYAWAHVEVGACSGNKHGLAADDPGSSNAFECEMQSQLLRTTDGGQNWIDITPSIP